MLILMNIEQLSRIFVQQGKFSLSVLKLILSYILMKIFLIFCHDSLNIETSYLLTDDLCIHKSKFGVCKSHVL